MINKPIVSVIMPVYNGSLYLEQSINSVAIQNVPLELILVDDCSTDNSIEVIENCRTAYPNLKIIVKKLEKNSGVANARNIGVDLAKGEYIAFLDCDDWWDSLKLTTQLELMHNESFSLCCTARELATPNGECTGRIISPPAIITFNDLLKQNVIGLSSVIIKTEIAREFPMENDDCHEDYLMWLSVLKKYGNARGVQLPLLKYRKSYGAKTANKAKSAIMHYKSLKKFGFKTIKALFLFMNYAFNGIKNHGSIL